MSSGTTPIKSEPPGLYASTTLKRWGSQQLDYSYYWAFSVFLGWFGIDYWYLGAPMTGIFKFLVNSSTFGYWWIYDAINATYNEPTVRLFGPIMPIIGSIGCAGGRFRSEDTTTPQQTLDKHLNYMIYGIVLVFLGIIGGDSYLLGNTFNAWIRILSLISLIGIPIALIWWGLNVFTYFFSANAFLDDAWYYLGALSPSGGPCPSWFSRIFGFLGSLSGFNFPWLTEPLDAVKAAILKQPGKMTEEQREILINPAASTAATAFAAIPLTLKGGGTSFPSQRLGKLLPLVEQGSTRGMDSSNIHMLSLLLASTLAVIVVSSIVLSLRRSYQNERNTAKRDSQGDDAPPDPRVFGRGPKGT